jgi:hypothetical protein
MELQDLLLVDTLLEVEVELPMLVQTDPDLVVPAVVALVEYIHQVLEVVEVLTPAVVPVAT